MARRLTLLAAAMGIVVAAGCGFLGNDGSDTGDVAAPTSQESSFEPLLSSPTPEPVESSTQPTTKPTRKPKVAATIQPYWEQLPECAHKDKAKPVAKSAVKAALRKASAKIYWPTRSPDLKLNYPLVKAVAWMESGWQSNIHNCDGGIGIMQVMPDTVAFVNNRFGVHYDATKYQDNAYAGANFLAWLAEWASEQYFHDSHSLSTGKCKSTTSWCLLNLTISGYQAGQGEIEKAAASRKLPNPQYVATVRALMTRCRCDQY